jgi:hypothetical protein
MRQTMFSLTSGSSVKAIASAIVIALALLTTVPPLPADDANPPAAGAAQDQSATAPIKQEELDQILAPVALYPDSLLSQILMASTYPLEIVQADRWVSKNKDLQGDALADALENQDWDPSVKSLVNFPQVLDMMSDKLDWTVKLGDAFIGQQAQVMETVQTLRVKAQQAGNLTSNEQQKVIVQAATVTEPQVIVIEPANPQIIYVPTYNPTIIYGPWWYPAYPPYYWYPPGYVVRPGIWWGVGFRFGVAWGYAWGGCNWRGRNINININRNININTRINRTYYQNRINRLDVNARNGQGTWRHDSRHREGVPYRDRATAQQFGRGSSDRAQAARDNYRGRTQPGSVDAARPNRGNTPNRQGQGGQRQPGARQPGAGQGGSQGSRGGAFDMDRGNRTQNFSQRGASSRGQGQRGGSGGGGRPGGGGGGGGRGGGGGTR